MRAVAVVIHDREHRVRGAGSADHGWIDAAGAVADVTDALLTVARVVDRCSMYLADEVFETILDRRAPRVGFAGADALVDRSDLVVSDDWNTGIRD